MTSVIQQWMLHPVEMNRETLDELRVLMLRYPYFQTLRLMFLENLSLTHDGTLGDELRKSVMYVADRRVLFKLIEEGMRAFPVTEVEKNITFAGVEEPGVDRTLTLIDAFLSTMPKKDTGRMELDYTMDYMAYLMNKSDEESVALGERKIDVPKLKGQKLIDGFIHESKSAKRIPLPISEIEINDSANKSISPLSVSTDELDDSYFTETLAKIYIKQHRYEKALEIIKKLSLNFPKKSAYFADQIKELERMIINTKSE